MKIWRLSDPGNHSFARADRRGTWRADDNGIDQRVEPLIIEWQPDSDVIGDFVWPGLDDDVVVSESVAQALKEQFKGFRLGQVEMIQNERLYKLKRGPKKRRVLLPYKGPALFDFRATHCVNLDLTRSSVELSDDAVGRTVYTPIGVEEYRSQVDLDAGKLRYRHFPREAGKGLVVRSDDLRDNDVFHIEELMGWKFCTGEFKDFIESHEYSNVRFLEMGDAM